jgi:PilZ domain
MAFWIKKKQDENDFSEENSAGSSMSGSSLSAQGKLLKKKDEKKENKPRRIDNLRIPQQLSITLRSLGSPVEIPFLTKDLSSTGAFILCPQFRKTPFQLQSTIMECIVELKHPETQETQQLKFLAKIARVVAATGTGASSISGFGVRICQIALDQKVILEQFIQKHGSPEVSAQTQLEAQVDEKADLQIDGSLENPETKITLLETEDRNDENHHSPAPQNLVG